MPRPGCYNQWMRELTTTFNSLMLQYEQRNTPPQDGELSLVAFARPGGDASDDQVVQVHLLHWYSLGVSGRIADLDERNGVKAIVPVGAKRWPLNFHDLSMKMILSRTGTYMLKEKRKSRPVLQTDVVRIMKLWNLSLSFKNGLTAEHFAPSNACDFCDSGDSSKGDCRVCPCCLTTGHASCFDAITTAYGHARERSQVHRQDGHSKTGKRQCIAWPIPNELPAAFQWDAVFSSSQRLSGCGWVIVSRLPTAS